MAHHSRLDKIVLDFSPADHDAAVAFWSGALGQQFHPAKRYPEYHWVVIEHYKMGVLTQCLGEGPSRVHLDFHTDNAQAEVQRLEALGAKQIREINGWFVMEDPAGLTFCVIPDQSVNETNSHRWE